MGNPATCVNTDGSYVCNCNHGYTIDTNTFDCIDINECDSNACGGTPATCDNFDGGFQCGCQIGYVSNSNNFDCTDFNECNTHNVCQIQNGNPVQCINQPGTFECQCNDGFSADATGWCSDQNDCQNNPCASFGDNVDCKNNDGPGYECICHTGRV